jgi:alkylated DNA nucleotide flippase Atl1
MDARFCAVCNRKSRITPASGAIGRVALDDVIAFLNAERVRATYGAVAEVVGVPARSLGALLGERRREASWIVNASTGLPTDYTPDDTHPELLSSGDVIATGRELLLRLAARQKPR